MPMYSASGNAALPALGFPIRESADHRLFSAYPRLIAAVHALHRLLVPRHPPCALPILTVIGRIRLRRMRTVIPVCWHGCAVFKVRKEAHARTGRSVSQNSTACAREPRGLRAPGPVDVSVAGRARRRGMRRRVGRPLQSWSFPRKEVIQPHLPVRLPCYDFTPVTSPTFDGSLPKG